MEISILKRKMKKLWKDTFHDSDDYISIVFDNYFDPNWIEYHLEGDEVISALIGIPYTYSNGKAQIQGLYLCGLATKEQYRHKGLMVDLIERINRRAKENGIAFTFLIPANDMLRIFYQNHGYINGLYRVEERYTNIHNFEKDCMSIIKHEEERIKELKKSLYRDISVNFYDKIEVDIESDNTATSLISKDILKDIVAYIRNNEEEAKQYAEMQHTKKDIEATIRDLFISGGCFFISKNSEDHISGVAYGNFDEKRNIVIPKIYYNDYCSYYKLLDRINSRYPESSLLIYRFPEETHRYAIWSKVYGAANPNGGMLGGAYGMAERVYNASLYSIPYGMVQLLNLYEILIFLSKDRRDLKFSILVKEENSDKNTSTLYRINKGEVKINEIPNENIQSEAKDHNLTILNFKDLAEIILRKKDGNSLIMEAFGIPRLALNMALLLD